MTIRQIFKDYIAYTAKIGELATRFSWPSVLLFDKEYRERQAMYNFRWGVDCPHLSTVFLKERVSTSGWKPKGAGAYGKQSSRGNVAASSEGPRPFCKQFNRGACTYGTRCNFEHSCSECRGNHSFADHDKWTKTSIPAAGMAHLLPFKNP